jgi:hypothetical protein
LFFRMPYWKWHIWEDFRVPHFRKPPYDPQYGWSYYPCQICNISHQILSAHFLNYQFHNSIESHLIWGYILIKWLYIPVIFLSNPHEM